MIKNERQYRVTRGQLDHFRAALDERRSRVGAADLRSEFELAAVEAQAAELSAELDEYDALRHGRADAGRLETLDQLPRLLIRSRIVLGMTQRDLAERLGMQEQQVQRYESNDWATASLTRLIEVAQVLGVSVGENIVGQTAKVDAQQFTRQLSRAGLEKSFVERRLVPLGDSEEGFATVLDLAAGVHRIFGWSPSEVLAGTALEIELPLAAGFKWPKGASEPRGRAYTVYSHYLALIALDSTASLATHSLPVAAGEFRAEVLRRSNVVNFETVLDLIWDCGIPVLPLSDPGGFHAVLWRTGGRNAIVLKQQNRTTSRWAFDLLHECMHAGEQPSTEEYSVLDDDPRARGDDEIAANRFAGDVLLDGRAEPLAQECVEEARGSIEALTVALPRVALRNNVNKSDLANYMAYRLSLQGLNWWGAATNLQTGGADPWALARDYFLRKSDLGALNPLDRGLLVKALAE